MKEPIKLLILEDDEQECAQFEQCAEDMSDISIIGCTADAEKALEIALKQNPDAIIIDLELHYGKGNGLQFLSELQRKRSRNSAFLLVTTNNPSRTTHEAARKLGADFILTKYEADYSASYVINFLKMMHTTMKNENNATAEPSLPTKNYNSVSNIPESEIMQYIHERLLEIGINPKAVGFPYLADSVFIKLKNPDENLYQILGPKYKKADASIERAMQYAINRAWRTGNPEDLLDLYTARIHSERGVPTIMEFVFFYVSKVQDYFNIK